MWLNVLDNEVLHLVAETAAIVFGSILMGILLAYLYWGHYKKRIEQLTNKLDFEKNKVVDLTAESDQLSSIRDHLVKELTDERNKTAHQSKTIYDQNNRLSQYEFQLQESKSLIHQMSAELKRYESRFQIIESELQQPKEEPVIKGSGPQIVRANYDHVSRLLGRQVSENDLTLITGIGPRTASLLQAGGIHTWNILAGTSVEDLRKLLNDAGGNFRSIDPTHWPRQAVMASQSEWRKLRVFQETLKKIAG